jgi:hypothetical protein
MNLPIQTLHRYSIKIVDIGVNELISAGYIFQPPSIKL